MFCSKCGKKLREGDLFCSNCGNPIFKENDSVTVSKPDIDEKNITFSIGKYSISFTDNQNTEILARSVIENNIDFSYIYFCSYCTFSVDSIEEMYEDAITEFKRILDLNINKAVKFLLNLDIDSYDYTYIKSKISERDLSSYWDSYYEGLNRINSFVEQIEEGKSIREAQKSPWRGGGFGFKGAIKGAAEASVLNFGSNILGGISNAFLNYSEQKELEKLKANILDNKRDYLVHLEEILYVSMDKISQILRDILIEEGYIEKNNWLSYEKTCAKIHNLVSRFNDDEIDYDTAVENLFKTIENNPFQTTSFYSLQSFGNEMKYSIIPLSIYFGLNSIYYKNCLYSKPFKDVHPFLSSLFYEQYSDELLDNLTDGKEISKIIKSDSRIELSIQYYEKIKKNAKKIIENSYAINFWNDDAYQIFKEKSEEDAPESEKLGYQCLTEYFEAGWLGAYPLECVLFMGKDFDAGYDEEFQVLTLDLPEEEPTLENGFSRDEIIDYYTCNGYIDMVKKILKQSIPKPDFVY